MKYTSLLVVSWIMALFLSANHNLLAQSDEMQFDPGRIYVKVADNSNLVISLAQAVLRDPDLAELAPLIADYQISQIRRPFLALQTATFDRTYEIEFGAEKKVDELIRAFEQIDWIEYAEPIPLYEIHGIPNDALWSSVSGHLQLIKADSAWDIHTGGGAKIAIVDNAIQTNHPDLAPNMWVNAGEIPGNGIDDDQNGYIDDVHGYDVADDDGDPNPPSSANSFNFSHGSHCAGIASGSTENGIGIASVGHSCQIIGIKATSDGGNDRFISNAVEGFAYAIVAEADVISASYGGGFFFQTADNMAQEAHNRGIMVVASAGNNDNSAIQYPANYDNVISVANTNNQDRKSSSSTYGSWVDVSAPGTDIVSTVAFDGYTAYTGTSMSAPMVAGLLGLMKSYKPGYPKGIYEYAMLETADPIDDLNPNYYGQLGAGRINAFEALKRLDCFPLAANLDGPRIDTARIGEYSLTSEDSCSRFTFDPNLLVIHDPDFDLPISLDLGTCGTVNPRQVAAFLDWNGDGDFSDSLETIWLSPTMAGNDTLSTLVSIPSFVQRETRLRMRIIVREGTGVIDPCSSFFAGETQEYLISFIPGICPPGTDLVQEFSYVQDFETFTTCDTSGAVPCALGDGWTNGEENDLDWYAHQGATSTSNTGPSGDFSPDQIAGTYVYVEGSRSGGPEEEATLLSPCFDLSGLEAPEVSFLYHMFGSDMGTLVLEARGIGLWQTMWSTSGNRQDIWREQTVDLSLLAGQVVKLRFVYISREGERSDVAIGLVNIGDAAPCNGETVLHEPMGEIEDGSGLFRDYPNFNDCRWLIQPYNTESIKVTLERFRTIPNQDFLYVYAGENDSAVEVASYAGFVTDSLTVAGGNAYLRFATDSAARNEGFLLSYEAIPMPDVLDFDLEPQSAAAGESIRVPLRVTDFTDMLEAKATLVLDDSSKARFVSASYLPQGVFGDLFTTISGDTLFLQWNTKLDIPYSLDNGDTLAFVAIELLGSANDTAYLMLDDATPETDVARRAYGNDDNFSLVLPTGDTTELLILKNTSINHASDQVGLSASPNPFEDRINVQVTIPTGPQAQLIVYDALGRIQQRLTLEVSQGKAHVELGTSQWAQGLYLIEVVTPAGRAFQKVWRQ